jgi:glutathione S-transferase
MKLYFSPGACSLASHIALREAGLDFRLEKVDLRTHRTADGRDYYAINPKGYVPALELDDGAVLTEGAAILQYIADQRPAAGLAPAAGTLDRYRLQEWLGFIGTELHKSFSPLFNPTTPDDVRAATRERLEGRFGFTAAALDGRPFLLGEHFTVADAYLYTVLGWTKAVGIDRTERRVLDALNQRVGERPTVGAARDAEKQAS